MATPRIKTKSQRTTEVAASQATGNDASLTQQAMSPIGTGVGNAPAPPEPSGTSLDQLIELMDPMLWRLYLSIITYTQMIDDMAGGGAKLSTEYQGAVLAPFIGFGPANLWNAMQQDLKHTLLRVIVRWMKDPSKRVETSLTWLVIDQITPGFCLMSKGEDAHDASLVVLDKIKQDFA